MILNPYANKEGLATYTGTRILQRDFGLIGRAIPDPFTRYRTWFVQALYAPVGERASGGLRAKLQDEKGFITFANQMDLEVLLGLGKPGSCCRWSGTTYSEPGERGFYGLCCDDDDLVDDLYDRELLLRGETPSGALLPNQEILRRLHMEESIDIEELHLLIGDMDPETGFSPDSRIETIQRRWVRVERLRLPWENVA